MNHLTENIIKVRISEIAFADGPAILRTTGLGSCVGIIIFDTRSHLAGMAHVMLPSIQQSRTPKAKEGKYADTAIPALFKFFSDNGVTSRRLAAKMAGGAEMFKFSSASLTSIGKRNVAEIKKLLDQYKIPVHAEDTGGHSGRSIDFDTSSKMLKVKTVNKEIQMI